MAVDLQINQPVNTISSPKPGPRTAHMRESLIVRADTHTQITASYRTTAEKEDENSPLTLYDFRVFLFLFFF